MTEGPLGKKRYVRAVGPKLGRLLTVVFALFALLAVNSTYLVAIRILEWRTGETYQDYFYLVVFLAHLVLGVLMIAPVVVFGVIHLRNAIGRPNRRAVRAGLALFTTSIVLLVSGVLLTRLEGFVEIKSPIARSWLYGIHVAAPLVAAWLFVLHRLAGRRLRWRLGLVWAGVALAFAALMLLFQNQDPRAWNVTGPASGQQYFFPSLARTASGNFIPAETLMMDDYCAQCHGDAEKGWAHSMHRFSSFNNPAYLFSVRETRRVAFERDGNVQASRFCAGCHDPVPFFSGAFDDPDFDDVHHATANAGITCTSCHAITHVNSPRGNADYTLEEPLHYPWARSETPALRWLNRQLVKAKPGFHKKTFLKPLHRTPEFCGACHKVHLPPEINHYRWLRGQNHYDSFLQSGVSGHGVTSFYYPEKAEPNCNGCHMPLQASEDFAARDFDGSGTRSVHDHQFPAANTAIPHLLDMPPWVNEAHARFLEGTCRVDVFGIRRGAAIDAPLEAPIGHEVPAVRPGETVLVEVVLRTLELGHLLTQGTADSNELWVQVRASAGERVLGVSGARDARGEVDPWSHFVNAYVLDREGRRIDRRNAQDIFVPLYDHQIPPGAADVVHYRLDIPPDVHEPVRFEARLLYRKFDAQYMRYVYGEDYVNDLPVVEIAADVVEFPVGATPATRAASEIPTWQRWNDYGIGLLRKGAAGSQKGQLRQAEEAFVKVESLGRADGPLNLARVYLKEGRLDDAVAALRRAAAAQPPAPAWTLDWFTALVNRQNGYLDEAIASFERLVDTRYSGARERGFDFSRDSRVWNELGRTLHDRAKLERRPQDSEARQAFLRRAEAAFQAALGIDPESADAHYGLALVYAELGDGESRARHAELHERYKIDDNARDRALAAARARSPAADHAANAIVIYDLGRAVDRRDGKGP